MNHMIAKALVDMQISIEVYTLVVKILVSKIVVFTRPSQRPWYINDPERSNSILNNTNAHYSRVHFVGEEDRASLSSALYHPTRMFA
jgi:hypothetical protein